MADKAGVIADCKALQHMLTDTTAMEQEIAELSKRLGDSTAELRKHVEGNMRSAKDQSSSGNSTIRSKNSVMAYPTDLQNCNQS